jgi:raffinose/stachyose/melibiose transport system permease protein
MAAYALARRTGPGLRWISAYLLGATTLPIQLYLFPLYFGFAHLGLIDNVFALSFAYSAVFSPFAIFLLRSYYLAIPKELEEAAIIDGANAAPVHPRGGSWISQRLNRGFPERIC